jgi:hypothetical protein
VIHVRDVDRAVWRRADVHRPEQQIRAQQELRAWIRVAKLREPFALDDLRATNQPADWLGEQQVTLQIGRHAVAPDNVWAVGGREMIQHAERHAHPAHAALHVGDAGDWPHPVEICLELIGDAERAVMNRRLEIHGPALAAGIHKPGLAVIVHREPPLARVRSRRFPQHSRRRPTEAKRVIRAVDPVVESPDESALLVLEVAVAAKTDAGVKHGLLVSHAVAVRVRVFDDVVRVRFIGEDAVVVEGKNHAGQDQLVDEHRALVELAVAFRALPPRDAIDRIVLMIAVRVWHVSDELCDVHPSVAVELDDGGADDVRFGGNELHPIARWQQERLLLLGRCLGQNGGPGRQIDFIGVGHVGAR